jgi:hypothetical protein
MLRTLAPLLFLLSVTAPALAKSAEKHPLPIQRVVLFTSGVAYVEHRGEVEGDAAVDFRFHVDDVNDLLKSMVVQDEGGGRIETVTYTPQEPIAVQLGKLRVDPSRVRSLGDLLALLRGQKLQVELTPSTIKGTIVSVEKRKVPQGDSAIDEETLLLKTDAGLRNISLASAASVKLLNEALDQDLQQALELMAATTNSDKKLVTLRLHGKGKRNVRVGYIHEFPVWKTSYRLVVGEKKTGLLQGWAIVENTTEHDWEDVQVSLVSGRPVSFVMDLYQPLFLERPKVVPQLFAGLSPRVHQQNLADAEDAFRRRAPGGFGGFGGGGFGGGGLGGFGGGGLGGGGFGGPSRAAEPINPRESVQPAAAGAQIGTFFRYAIEHPVTLASQKSAMLPIVNDDVAIARKAVFHPKTHAKHPMAALELTNTTKLHLMQGPITIFDAGEYAGDAQIEDLAPQSKRLVTYAMDLNLEFAMTLDTQDPFGATAVQLRNGRVYVQTKVLRKHHYLVKNSNDSDRALLIEQAIEDPWKLVSPPTSGKTRDLYRFAVDAKPGVPAKLTVVEQQTIEKSQLFTTLGSSGKIEDDSAYKLAQSATERGPALKEALDKWREKHDAIAVTRKTIHEGNRQRDEIISEQSRIRQNLAQVPRESDLYRRYIETLSKQEDALAKLAEERKTLETKAQQQENELQEFLEGLNVQ